MIRSRTVPTLTPTIDVQWGRTGDLYIPNATTAAPVPEPAPADGDTVTSTPVPNRQSIFAYVGRPIGRALVVAGRALGRMIREWVPKLLAILGVAVVFTAVGGPAAVASYLHSIHIAQHFGADPRVVDYLPLTTDGMLVAGLVLMGIQRWRNEPVHIFAWVAFGLGMVATVGANIGAYLIAIPVGKEWEIGGIVVAFWPPAALALTLELVAMTVNIARGKTSRPPRRKPVPKPVTVPDTSKTKTTKTSTSKPNTKTPKPGALTDEQIIEKARAYMAETNTAEMVPGTLRRLYGIGTSRAEKLAALIMGGTA